MSDTAVADRELRNRALAWWKDAVERGEYVVGRDAFPGAAERTLLANEGLVVEVGGGIAWILTRPAWGYLPNALYPNYWKVVGVVLRGYQPAVVERISAVRVLSEEWTPPAVLHVRQGANASKRRIELVPGHDILIRPGAVDPARVATRESAGVAVPVDDPALTLLELPVEHLRDAPETVGIWLKSLVVPRAELEAAYATRPRPVVLKRLGLVAREAGNALLADTVDQVLRSVYPHPMGRGHTARGPRIVVSPFLSTFATAHQPWLDRQAATFARFREAIAGMVGDVEPRLPRFGRELLLRQAREAKAFDAYHSTTIEGYRITPAEVSAIISGAPVGGHDPVEVRSRMAVAGYSRAFERVLAGVAAAEGPVAITEPLIQTLYVELFAPSVEAGVVDARVLGGWRTEPAYLRGHAHVPPGPEKLARLIRQYEDLVNGIAHLPLTRAILAHLEFVTVHPYPDGNGRLARFLMNLALLGGGLPWVTIRNDERPEYFAALHAAQVEGDPLPFARFVFEYVERSVSDTRARWPGG